MNFYNEPYIHNDLLFSQRIMRAQEELYSLPPDLQKQLNYKWDQKAYSTEEILKDIREAKSQGRKRILN